MPLLALATSQRPNWRNSWRGTPEAFLARFIAYPTEAATIAHTLWVAHTRLMGPPATQAISYLHRGQSSWPV